MSDTKRSIPVHLQSTDETYVPGKDENSIHPVDLDDLTPVDVPREAIDILREADIPIMPLVRTSVYSQIGSGGYARVYDGMRKNRSLAIKIILRNELRTPKRVINLAKEIFMQHLVETAPRILGADLSQMCFYMTTVCDRTLKDEIDQRQFQNNHEKFVAGSKSIEAVTGATTVDIVHGDVKPGNLMRGLGILDRVFLGDFSVSRHPGDAYDTRIIAATPDFAAPEQVSGTGQKATVATDVYGLGATLFQLLHQDHKTLTELSGASTVLERLNAVIERKEYGTNIAAMARKFGSQEKEICDLLHGCLAQSADQRWAIDDVQQSWDQIARKI